MSVGVDDERRIVVRVVARPLIGRAVVDTTHTQCRGMKRADRLTIRSAETEMQSAVHTARHQLRVAMQAAIVSSIPPMNSEPPCVPKSVCTQEMNGLWITQASMSCASLGVHLSAPNTRRKSTRE